MEARPPLKATGLFVFWGMDVEFREDDEPFRIEITDVLDLHTVPPRDVTGGSQVFKAFAQEPRHIVEQKAERGTGLGRHGSVSVMLIVSMLIDSTHSMRWGAFQSVQA